MRVDEFVVEARKSLEKGYLNIPYCLSRSLSIIERQRETLTVIIKKVPASDVEYLCECTRCCALADIAHEALDMEV